MRTIDYVKGVTLPDAFVSRHSNAMNALETLRLGLSSLRDQVAKVESIRLARNPIGRTVLTIGNDPLNDGIPMRLLECVFHWYSVSACNFVRLVGDMIFKNGGAGKSIDYVEEIIPGVKSYRDKIGAHIVQLGDDPRDNSAERDLSAMPSVSFYEDAYFVNALMLASTKKGVQSTTNTMTPWSLTRVHAELSKRYWPQTIA